MKCDYYTISSKKRVYIFAPEWEVNFLTSNISNLIDLKEIRSYLINEEENILRKYPPKLMPGVNNSSTLTSRYMEYNLFDHAKNITCIQNLRSLILEAFYKLIKESGDDNYYDPYVYCWYTITRPGEIIEPHRHDNFEMSFLSGNLIIDCENSETVYEMPYQQDLHYVKNRNGEMTLFPSHLLHWTTPHVGKNKRVSIAFDFKENLNGCPDFYMHRFCKLNK